MFKKKYKEVFIIKYVRCINLFYLVMLEDIFIWNMNLEEKLCIILDF